MSFLSCLDCGRAECGCEHVKQIIQRHADYWHAELRSDESYGGQLTSPCPYGGERCIECRQIDEEHRRRQSVPCPDCGAARLPSARCQNCDYD